MLNHMYLYINTICRIFYDWQSKGHRFDSDILHLKIKGLQIKWQLFFCINKI